MNLIKALLSIPDKGVRVTAQFVLTITLHEDIRVAFGRLRQLEDDPKKQEKLDAALASFEDAVR